MLAWPMEASEEQRAKVEQAAQAVLDARTQFPGSTLADLYDPNAMPPALAKAHEQLDRAVDRCYRTEPFTSERQRVEFLFGLYERIAAPLAVAEKKRRRSDTISKSSISERAGIAKGGNPTTPAPQPGS